MGRLLLIGGVSEARTRDWQEAAQRRHYLVPIGRDVTVVFIRSLSGGAERKAGAGQRRKGAIVANDNRIPENKTVAGKSRACRLLVPMGYVCTGFYFSNLKPEFPSALPQ